MTGYKRLMLGLLLLMAFPSVLDAQLAQADGKLPAGLIVHLDATAAEVGLIAELQDLAVATRVFLQPEDAARPEVVAVGESRVLRFDGVDDHLRVVATGLESDAFTLFVVAAPHANPGEFQGFFAANAAGQRDYESGLTVDLGPGPSRSFDVINVEGKGFGGARDLRQASAPFGGLHLLEVVADPEAGEVRLLVDGKREGARPFAGDTLSLDELTLGGRYYTNGPGPQQVRGSLAGDVAEVLLFDRALTADEATAVRERLLTRHALLAESLREAPLARRDGGVPLELAENPPLIQMLVPGFEVREIPVQLANVNNVRFREDGALVTLGYGGDIHLLRDTDGDGLEDTATRWYHNEGSLRGPIGLLVTPPGYEHGDGMFVASKGKVSLFLDHDGDDAADEERVVATGWQEITQNVDATGLAMGADGSLYFALDVADYSNAYLLDAEGKSHYDVRSERGTIQRVSPDLSRREAVCTGIRFPIALAFNDRGDLFCTEQEGATWMPNGNPFDELLHIRLDGTAPRWNVTGMQHFGFPPRHPRHNPGVLDEPSTFDYGPQHQSACGMVFNPAVADQKPFGPRWWAGDAIVCGESRGKLWRTTLVPTAAGYVATSQLVAALQMLCVDACVAANGDLVVACHSGPPDWGTGPAGVGKLFRISMRSVEAPRPVVAWAEGQREIRVAFDRPLSPASLAGVAEKAVVEYGAFVRAADRFETLEPPYAVVQAQKMAPRHRLRVVSAALTADRRTVVLGTDPIPLQTHLAVSLPWTDDSNAPAARTGSLTRQAAVDVDASTAGVAVRWHASAEQALNEGSPQSSTAHWLPHLDLAVSERLTRGSSGHEELWTGLREPGRLELETRVNLTQLLRPAVQPGSQLDHEWPPETAAITITSDRAVEVEASVAGTPLEVTTQENARGDFVARFESPAGVAKPVDLAVSLATGGVRSPQLTITFHTNEDGTERPLPLHRFILPWATTSASELSTAPLAIAELEGGSWGRGRRVFLSDTAGCSKCHSVAGDGAMIGPDLGNLVHRDFASVSRDIRHPSFAINPDFTTHIVHLADGRVLTGILQTRDGSLMLGDNEGKWTRLDRDAIEQMEPSAVSVMPAGILDKLSAEETRDLLTFLLTPPPAMPLESPLDAPPVRSQAEVTAALAGSEEVRADRPLTIVLVDGEKDHGPGEHDYPAWRNRWVQLLAAAEQVTVTPAREFPSQEQLEAADVLVFFQRGSFADRRPQAMDAFLARGGGAVYIHWAVDGRDRAGEFSRRIGLASDSAISFRHGPLELAFSDREHPIIRNFSKLALHDESYWKLIGNPAGLDVLATSLEDGEPTPQLWTKEVGEGRVFVSIPGHYSWTFDDPLFRILLLRGIAWAAHEPVDRFNALVTPGARMSR